MSFETKVRFIGMALFVGFLLIFSRLFYIQVLSTEKFSAQAEKQHFYRLFLPARRGEIKAVDNFPLSADKDSYLLYAHLPELTTNKELVAKNLAKLLAEKIPIISTDSAILSPEDKEKYLKKNQKDLEQNILERLNHQNALWVNLFHFLDSKEKTKIEEMHFSGLGFTTEDARDYPEASMAAHVLGLVGSDPNGNPKGYFGLEGFYDRELSGKPGEIRVEKDAFGRPIAIGQELRKEKADGRNLVTTINRPAQLFVQQQLIKGISDWKATGGTAIVMDPNDGAILAMSSFPNYEPDRFQYFPTSLYKNPAIANLYEPGSILKPLVMAAAINENKVTPETKCDQCDGPKKIGEYYIHTFNDKYHPNLNMVEVLINSDNTGMAFVGEKLSFTRLYNYMKHYKFGQKTGVDLQEEEEGSLRDINDYYPIDKATLTFGQGINVNALQIMRAWSSLANGGYIITPHFVSEIEGSTEKISLKWPKGEKVLSNETTKLITEMLVRVANESPTHFPKDRIPELSAFRLAVKSGTAQIALGGKYREKGTIASVIGYFPAAKPRFLVMVKLNEPEVRPWGADTAGPVFFAIVKNLIEYYGISP